MDINDSSTQEQIGLIGSVINLIEVAESVTDHFSVRHHGLIFEKSGDSMAVFDGPERIDRVTLRDCSEQTFLEAIDAWELARYMAVA